MIEGQDSSKDLSIPSFLQPKETNDGTSHPANLCDAHDGLSDRDVGWNVAELPNRIVDDGLLGHAAGRFLLPLDDDPNTTLQDNILTAWQAGQIVGADVVGVISGTYVPEPSTISLLVLGLLICMFDCRAGKVIRCRE